MHGFLGLLLLGALHAQTVNYTYDEAGRLTRVVYPNGKIISYSYDAAGNLLRLFIGTPAAGPAPATTAAAVVNAASNLGGPVSPGEIVTLFGTNIGPPALAGAALNRFGFVDGLVAETAVLFDGAPAPIVYASAAQTAVIVPYSVAGKQQTQMIVEYQGRRSIPVGLPVAATALGLFSANLSGTGNGAIINEDGSLNSPDNPAPRGTIVTLFGTGEGQTDPAGIDGRPATTVFPKPATPMTVRIGGLDAEVIYYGAAPNLVAGLFQANARVPMESATGSVPVTVSVGAGTSQSGLTVAVR
jgi:uncharacterized protein (TIGR03437 family)